MPLFIRQICHLHNINCILLVNRSMKPTKVTYVTCVPYEFAFFVPEPYSMSVDWLDWLELKFEFTQTVRAAQIRRFLHSSSNYLEAKQAAAYKVRKPMNSYVTSAYGRDAYS